MLVEEFGLRPDPRFGDCPMVVEAFRAHDPKDNPPDEPDRLFQFVPATYADGAVCVALYPTKADAEAGAPVATRRRGDDRGAGGRPPPRRQFAEWGLQPVTAGALTTHGDTVLITGLEGEELAIDADTVVELLHRPPTRHGAA